MPKDNKRPSVSFHVSGDGLKPRQVEWGVLLRLPIPVKIPAGGRATVDYLVAPSLPCFIVPMRRLSEYGLSVEAPDVASPGENVRIVLRNDGKSDVVLEARDSLVSLSPLRWDGEITIEGGD